MELPVPLPSPHRPPLACVYPGACVIATQHRRPRLLAVCDCGAWGPPNRLAWMGPHCGPCFDRGAGELLASPAVLPAGGSVHGVAFSPGGTRLAVWDQFGEVALWDIDTGRPPVHLRGVVRPPGKLAFSPDGAHLAWCSRSHDEFGLIHLDSCRATVRRGTAFAFTPVPVSLVTASSAALTRFELDAPGSLGQAVTNFRLPFPIPCIDLAVSPDGRLLAAAAGEQGLCLWEVHSGEPLHRDVHAGATLRRADEESCCGPVAWSPDGTVLACGVAARFWKAILWDAITRQRRAVVAGQTPLHALAFSPDGQWLVTCEEDAIRTWYVATGQERRSLALPSGEQVLSLAFSPNGRTVALGMVSGRVRLWPAEILHPEA
jgi:WD40 repeat protein